MLSLAEICKFADCTPSTRNFIEGEKVLHAGHVLFCGKQEISDEDDFIPIIAFCLQSSNLKNTPHEIKGKIKFDGIIKEINCSCKAGLSQKCKHVVAVLLHLHTTDLRTLPEASSTDTKCLWNTLQTKKLEVYEPVPLREHDCLNFNSAKQYCTSINDEDEEYIKNLLYNFNENSALRKHMCGRHEALVFSEENNNNSDLEDLEALLENLPSQEMKLLEKLDLKKDIQECCKAIVSKFSTDTRSICQQSFLNKKQWHEHRQFRITGSRCYAIFTYMKNKNPHWEDKSLQYFYPKSFKATKEMKHGLENESFAREIYSNQKKVEVKQFGLIVPGENPWLGYSPDGIVFKDGKPDILIEIKCPFIGKSKSIKEIISQLKYVQLPENKLKKKHQYYGQVQLGMAILNLKKTDLIIYASFDKSIHIISVEIDLEFINSMLNLLKEAYFLHMVHYICLRESL